MEMQIIAVILALIVVFLAIIIFKIWSDLNKLKTRIITSENNLNRISDSFFGISTGAVGQGEHIAKVEKDIDQIRSRLETIAMNEQQSAGHSQAIRMAKRGATSEDIAETCGLTRVESDLVIRLHSAEE